MTCKYCKKTINKQYIQVDGHNYHQECYMTHIAPKCSLCSQAITDKYFRDFWGNLYHWQHKKDTPSCHYCQRLIARKTTSGGKTYQDGRIICTICHNTAINKNDIANQLFSQVKKQMQSIGLFFQYYHSKFYLIDRDKLANVAKNPQEKTGFTNFQRVLENKRLKSFNMTIYILNGLPKMSFIATAAHELMHIWQYMNAPLDNHSAICEGSCNAASYLILKDYKTLEAEYLIKQLMENKDKDYGKGFRKVLAMIQDQGIEYWLSYLKKNRRLPLF